MMAITKDIHPIFSFSEISAMIKAGIRNTNDVIINIFSVFVYLEVVFIGLFCISLYFLSGVQ
jgi:hypothetical protein